MTPSLEGLPTKAKEAPSPNEVRLAPLDEIPQRIQRELFSLIKKLLGVLEILKFDKKF